MREFGDGDEASEVSQVRTLIVVLYEALVLGVVSLAEGFEGFVVSGG